MTKVITYGTYDLLHYGHIRLLERAKELGDYLIVGVTADDFDKTRGKINVQQSLVERIEAVKATGLADEIIVEEYEGQKIDDILRYGVDIFAVGSDWEGHFDYLNEYCKVVYLERTRGVSSSTIRSQNRDINLMIVGETRMIDKFVAESKYVNGISITGICSSDKDSKFEELLNISDAIYIVTKPENRYGVAKGALSRGKHVLCESPVSLKEDQCAELFSLAAENNVIFMEGLKTAYSTAYHRLNLLAKGGIIGKVVSVDGVCTSLSDNLEGTESGRWGSLEDWGPTAMLPIFQIIGIDYIDKRITAFCSGEDKQDDFTKIDFVYKDAVASLMVGKGVKSEGSLVVTGTKGYIYVPAPWWKTDYFEVRFENPQDNKRYFYQLDGEGIRYEILGFLRMIETGNKENYISQEVTRAISRVMEDFHRESKVINF